VVFVVFVVVVVVVVVVALLQDAKSIDVTIRNVIASQITPFFKISSFFSPSGKLIEKTSLDHQLNI
jgi:preprotein translocase subunit SecG